MDIEDMIRTSRNGIKPHLEVLSGASKTKFKRLLSRVEDVARLIYSERDTINVVHHVDADGLTSGGIIAETLSRLDKDFELFEWHLDPETLEEIPKDRLTVFVDAGTGQSDMLVEAGFDPERTVILDHHLKLGGAVFPYEANPTLFGLNGASELSGAGVTYLVSRVFGFHDLGQFAVVGAVGDMMNSFGKFVGAMRVILSEAVEKGYVSVEILPQFFGRETRPLFVSLTYLNEPRLFKDQNEAKEWLLKKGLVSNRDITKRLNDLSEGEIKILTRELLKRFLRRAPLILKPYAPVYLIGESYTLRRMPKFEPVRDATEFATLLNATNRQNRRDVGLSLILSGSLRKLDEAKKLLSRNRRQLRNTIVTTLEELDKRRHEYDFLVVLDETGVAPPHLSGTLLQLILDRLTPLYDKPLLGFTDMGDGMCKVSLREPKVLYLKGINLAVAVEKASRLVGGYGGGHPPACGGAVPKEHIGEFIKLLHRELTEQGVKKGLFIDRSG